jgi:hypothetical protein
MTAKIERKPELIWMAWSPHAGYLPQAASVSKEVCWAMVRERKYSSKVRVIRVQVSPPRKKR